MAGVRERTMVEALSILDRWQSAMDNPGGPPLEVHHADLAVLREAISSQQGRVDIITSHWPDIAATAPAPTGLSPSQQQGAQPDDEVDNVELDAAQRGEPERWATAQEFAEAAQAHRPAQPPPTPGMMLVSAADVAVVLEGCRYHMGTLTQLRQRDGIGRYRAAAERIATALAAVPKGDG